MTKYYIKENIEDIYPLSDIQKGMVFHSLKEKHTGVYYIQLVNKLEIQNFNTELFKRTIQLLINKHSILRTGFNIDEFNEPVQVVYKNVDPEIEYFNIINRDQKDQQKYLDEILIKDEKQNFDFNNHNPLWRIKIIQTNEDSLWFVWVCHHSIMDGWSNSSLMIEINNTYHNLVKDSGFIPNKLNSNYKNFIVEQIRDKQKKDIKEFWKEELLSYKRLVFPEETSEIIDKKDFKILTKSLGSGFYQKLKSISSKYEIPINNICFAAYVYALSIFSYDNDFVVGLITNNRPLSKDGDKILGCFLNTLPVRVKIPSQLNWQDFLKEIHNKILQLYKYKSLSLFEITKSIDQKSEGKNQLFNTVYNYTDYYNFADFKGNEKSIEGINEIVQIQIKKQERAIADTLLDFNINCIEDQINFSVNYSNAIISDLQLTNLFKSFEAVLYKFIEEPYSTICKSDIINKESKDLILNNFNDTTVDFPEDKTIHKLFEEQVLKTPKNLALIFNNEKINYQELNNKANAIASKILDNGLCKGGHRIGLLFESSIDMVSSMIGVLKSGGAYVPLSPDSPFERNKYIISDSNIDMVLIQKKLIEKDERIKTLISEDQILIVDNKNYETSGISNNPDIKTPVDSASYIIYTSGTTGMPKGVEVKHSGLINFIYWRITNYNLNTSDTTLQLLSYNFDGYGSNLYSSILSGGTLVLVNEEDRLSPISIKKVIENNGVTNAVLVPGIYDYVLKEIKQPDNIKLRFITLAGEKAQKELITNSKKILPDTILTNEYGPTEASIGASFNSDLRNDNTEIIGRPINNTKIFIVDENNDLLPIGVKGELCIQGKGLAIGYVNNKELTDKRFIKSPFSNKNEKLYKTGDFARWLSNGKIEFVGRIDEQVKIRGFRIELGEIESQLLLHNKIKEAVVYVNEKEGNKYLIAYYASGQELDIDELKKFLKQSLPDYMIPVAFVHLKKFPLTPNGKLDKKALPSYEIKAVKEYIAPSNKLEEELAEIWSEVLKIDKKIISVNNDFFELGGHSILAINLVSQIQKKLKIQLGLPDFFKDSTIKGLSELIKNKDKVVVTLPEIVINKEKRNKPFPLTDVQQAYWIGQKNLFDYGNINTHGYSEQFVQELDIDRFNRVIQKLISRHEMLRVIVEESGEQRILEEVPLFKAKILDLRDKSKEEEEELFYNLRRELSHQSFVSHQWPLFDLWITIFKDNTYKVHLSMDALVMDAQSSILLSNEYVALYSEEETKLPPIEVSFRDYVYAEIELKKSELYSKSKDYWLNRLDEFPLAPSLPILSKQNNSGKPRFERRSHFMKIKEWQTLQDIAKRLGITPTVLLIGCFGEVINRWSKTAHFILNLTLFNRIPFHKDVDKLVGDFTTLSLLEIDFRENNGFSEVLKNIQNRLWSDLEYKYFSGVEVQRELSRRKGSSVIMPIVITSILGLNTNSEDFPIDDITLQGIDKIKKNYSISQTPQVWIDFQMGDYKNGLHLSWDSIEGLFPDGMMDEMFVSFKKILNLLVDEEEVWNSKLPAYLPKKQEEIRLKTNSTEGIVTNKLMHELFQEQVAKRGDIQAIISSKRNVTYNELNIFSNVVGNKLRNLGVTPNKLVGIVMHKCWEQVAASMGILCSGAAYLPIDASLPQERILLLLEQGEVDIVLTTPEVYNKIKFLENKEVLVIEDSLLEESYEELENVQDIDDIAYVIFTSGSTGIPKGVVIDHKGVVNTLLDINERFNICSEDKVLALSSLSFDLSVYDVFGILGAGGTLVIPDQSEIRDPESWLRYINDNKITIWNTVPALMQMLMEYAEKGGLGIESLRLVLMSGDWIPLDLPLRIRNLNKTIEIISLGGATEASIWSIWYRIGEINPDWKSIPYGKPLKNQSFHVLKPDLSVCPDYVPGDLYIGGIGLAKEYWRDEEKTNNSFTIHPDTKERLYKTGDLGRYFSDGNIEFLGREDAQVKIQGYRIELGEIESAIEKNEYIKETAVIAKDTGNNTKTLVAYVVLEDEIQEAITGADKNEDNVGDLADSGNTIIDKQERSLFKIEQHGIRKEDSLSVITLDKYQSGLDLKLRDKSNDIISFVNDPLTKTEFSRVFDSLLQKKFNELILPKYYYPSAGSLYPVQVYVHVFGGKIEGVEGGYYYYNPQNHSLELINREVTLSNDSGNHSFTLHLVSDLDAISPMYGNLSEIFSHQEAGYMANLLLNTDIKDISLCLKSDFDKEKLVTNFKLKPSHLHLQSFNGGKTVVETRQEPLQMLFKSKSIKGISIIELEAGKGFDFGSISLNYLARKSYRLFEGEGVISQKAISLILQSILVKSAKDYSDQVDLNIYLVAKEGKIEGLTGGVYFLDPVENQLKLVNKNEESGNIFKGNDSIYDSSGFGILITGSKENNGDKKLRERSMYICGYLGQNMMNISTAYELGLCAIGTVDQASSREILELSSTEEVLHSFLGGKVTKTQIESAELIDKTSNVQNPSELLKEYLREYIPSYMIPSYYVPLDRLPLTSNGKINKKALPDVDVKINNDFVAPNNDLQKKLVKVWSELLKLDSGVISINRSFFELGGHSIRAIELSNRIKSEFNLEIPLKELFENETIEEQAVLIESEEWLLNSESSDNIEKIEILID